MISNNLFFCSFYLYQSEQSKKAGGAEAKPPTTSQSSSVTADQPKKSSSDTPTTHTAPSQPPAQPQHSPVAYTWDPSQLRQFSPWMYPSYPTIGGYPLHQTSSAVNSIPRFPYPPGHHFGHYEKPLMPVVSRSVSAVGQESNIEQPEDFPHCNTPAGDSDRSMDIPINPPEVLAEEKSQESKPCDTKEDGDSAARQDTPKPDEKFTETEASGVRQRSVQSRKTPAASAEADNAPSENGPNNENVDVADAGRQRLRHTRVNHAEPAQNPRDTSVRRRLDFTSVLIIVLSVCTVLILLKRVLQYTATGELI